MEKWKDLDILYGQILKNIKVIINKAKKMVLEYLNIKVELFILENFLMD